MDPYDRLLIGSQMQQRDEIRGRRLHTGRLDRAMEVLLIALLAFGPAAFGVVAAWSELIVIAMAGTVLMLFLVRQVFIAPQPLARTWAYVPLVAFGAIAVFQLTPLPAGVIGAISPETGILKAELLDGLPDIEQTLSKTPLTFYPRATKRDLRLVLAIAAVFFVVVNLYRDPSSIKRLLAAVAVIGGAVGLLALAQHVAGNGKIYWLVPSYDAARSGTFINHSHFGQFMNLSIGVALALLLVLVCEAFCHRHVTAAEALEYLRSREGLPIRLLAVTIVVGAAAVFLSLTRGGMVSMLAAAAFTTVVLCSRRSLRGRGWVLVLVALGAFVCILWLGFDRVYDRMATLDDLTEYHGRWEMIAQSVEAWKRFPAFGTGLGTFEVVYPMFDRGSAAGLATHAENEYIHALLETGAVGVLMLALFGALVWVAYARSVRAGTAPIRSAAYGLGFGLAAILVHSLSDFGQHLPANAMLTAICCALLMALTGLAPQTSAGGGLRRRLIPAVAHLALLVIAAGAFGWAIVGANAARAAEAHWARAKLAARQMEADGWRAEGELAEYLFAHAIAAARAEPDNIHHRHRLGVYQWQSLTPCIDPDSDALHPDAFPWARRIVEDLHASRPLCPTFGVLVCLAGEIEAFALADPDGAAHIRLGYRLAPCNAAVCLAAARIDVQSGRAEEAFEKLARAVRLNGGYFSQAAALCIDTLARPDLAVTLAGDSAGRLSHVADRLAASDRHPELAAQARQRALALLAERSARSDAPAATYVSLARANAESGDLDAAIDHYRLALRQNYNQVGWHYELACLLARAGRVDEAIHEARICLRLRVNHASARRLLEELSVRPIEPMAAGQ